MSNKFSTLASQSQFSAEDERAKYLESGYGSALDKNRSLPRFMSRQELAKLLAYESLFKMTRGLVGSIAECGVFFGSGFCAYANLAAALEPYNYQSKILGFDTFSGNEGLSEKDEASKVDFSEQNYFADNYDDLSEFIRIYDLDRPLGHIPKLELVRGDLNITASKYIEENPETMFRIIHLSVNIYEPTLAAIKFFEPRLVSGGIIAVHAVNYSVSPTKAVLDGLSEHGHSNIKLKTFDYYPNIVYWEKPV